MKICVVTTNRSDYGPLKWIINDLKHHKKIILQLFVTGTHFSENYGFSYHEIEEDGFSIDYSYKMNPKSNSPKAVVKAMSRCTYGAAEAFDYLRPDMIVVLGDRYELLSICSAALVMKIPIIHISGGDITQGAIDDSVRHAVTKLSAVHFVGTEEAAKRVRQMGEPLNKIFVVGEPGLDVIKRSKLLSRKALARFLSLDINKKWGLVTYHSETYLSTEKNLEVAKTILDYIIPDGDIQFLITAANPDLGGGRINKMMRIAADNSKHIIFIESLGQLRYISFLKESVIVVGNSSSGIIEAPMFGVPVVNIGNRQKGRICAENIISVDNNTESINSGIEKALKMEFPNNIINPHGDGNASQLIIKHLENLDPKSLLIKSFNECLQQK